MTSTTLHRVQQPAVSGALMTVAAMTCIQLGHAVSVGLFDRIGVLGASWLRLAWAGALILLIVRPRLAGMRRETLATAVLLGLVTAGATLLFMAAVARIPLGTASAIEFLGPLGVAILHARGRLRTAPLLAAGGVVLLTQPWQGGADLVGIAFALAAAVCWGSYILLTQAVGDEMAGLQGLAISFPVAGLVTTVVATLSPGPGIVPALSPEILLLGLPLALLIPLVPFSLELVALRRLSAAAFGTLMALEPALALLAGLVLLEQLPGWSSLAGVLLVVAAGVGAARGGARLPEAAVPPEGGAGAPVGAQRGS